MTKQTGQFGEYLVASELCRRGFIATTFTRNMPGFDILALDQETQKHLKIKVKTIKPGRGDWQPNAKHFLEFDKDLFETGVQKIIGLNRSNSSDFFVLVR